MNATESYQALDRRLTLAYPGQEPVHWGTVRRYAEGGPDPLDGISAYRAAGPPPHWHYVSFGLAEQGFEISFRLSRAAEDGPPTWPLQFLQQLARYVFNTGEPFGHCHWIRWGGPITAVVNTHLSALFFVSDSSLSLSSDELPIYCAVGITGDQYARLDSGDSEGFFAELQRDNPTFVTRLGG